MSSSTPGRVGGPSPQATENTRMKGFTTFRLDPKSKTPKQAGGESRPRMPPGGAGEGRNLGHSEEAALFLQGEELA